MPYCGSINRVGRSILFSTVLYDSVRITILNLKVANKLYINSIAKY